MFESSAEEGTTERAEEEGTFVTGVVEVVEVVEEVETAEEEGSASGEEDEEEEELNEAFVRSFAAFPSVRTLNCWK